MTKVITKRSDIIYERHIIHYSAQDNFHSFIFYFFIFLFLFFSPPALELIPNSLFVTIWSMDGEKNNTTNKSENTGFLFLTSYILSQACMWMTT